MYRYIACVPFAHKMGSLPLAQLYTACLLTTSITLVGIATCIATRILVPQSNVHVKGYGFSATFAAINTLP